MRTEKQIQASRANGARSKGPVTKQGKRNSSQNAFRHGLLAASVVVSAHEEPRLLELVANLYAEHQPATETERCLVDSMAVARWQTYRAWHAQRHALDQEIFKQPPGSGHVAQIAEAFATCPPELLLRYSVTFERQFHRALDQLLKLRKHRAAERTQQPVENAKEPPAKKPPAKEPAPKEPNKVCAKPIALPQSCRGATQPSSALHIRNRTNPPAAYADPPDNFKQPVSSKPCASQAALPSRVQSLDPHFS